MHGQNGKINIVIGKLQLAISYVCNKIFGREHNAFSYSRCARGIDNCRALGGIKLDFGQRRVNRVGIVSAVNIVKPIRVAHIYNSFQLMISFLYFFCTVFISVFIEERVNVAVLKKLAGFVNGGVGRKGNKNIAADKGAGQSGYVFICGFSDNCNMHFLGAYISYIAANGKAVFAKVNKAFLDYFLTDEIFNKRLSSV